MIDLNVYQHNSTLVKQWLEGNIQDSNMEKIIKNYVTWRKTVGP